VWLEVAVTNSAAIALYREFGFEDVRVRRRYYQPEDIDALVMRARLG
jgi:ribosomal-protein-alanine N-acetyltransferase